MQLETKIQALMTSSDLRCNTKMDFDKIFMGQKAHDKIGLGYVECPSLSIPKGHRKLKRKWGTILKI
jgi:hypothetical protein